MADGLLEVNSIICNRWQIEEKIGKGGFGEVYRCKDCSKNKLVALKLVSKDADPGNFQLYTEAKALRAIQGKKFFTRYYSYERIQMFDILVMELLGPNLRDLKKLYPNKKFPVKTTLSMSRMMLKSIEWLHDAGYLHRDIKPHNFAIGIEGKAERVYLIDFGLAKRYVYDSGELRPLKNKVSFEGTATYASAHVLYRKDPGRRDDIISLFYTLIELSTSKLPWKKVTSLRKIAKMKETCDYAALIAAFPATFLQFFDHLKILETLQRPDYGFLLSIIEKCQNESALMDAFNDETDDSIPVPVHINDLSLSSATMSSNTITGGNTSLYDDDFERSSLWGGRRILPERLGPAGTGEDAEGTSSWVSDSSGSGSGTSAEEASVDAGN